MRSQHDCVGDVLSEPLDASHLEAVSLRSIRMGTADQSINKLISFKNSQAE